MRTPPGSSGDAPSPEAKSAATASGFFRRMGSSTSSELQAKTAAANTGFFRRMGSTALSEPQARASTSSLPKASRGFFRRMGSRAVSEPQAVAEAEAEATSSGFLRQTGSESEPQGAAPAGFFRRLSQGSACAVTAVEGLWTSEEGKRYEGRLRSPRIAEALRRRKLRRNSNDIGAELLKAGAEAAPDADDEDSLLDHNNDTPLSAEIAASASMIQEQLTMTISSVESQLMGRLSTLEGKLDRLITKAEDHPRGKHSKKDLRRSPRLQRPDVPIDLDEDEAEPSCLGLPRAAPSALVTMPSLPETPEVSSPSGPHTWMEADEVGAAESGKQMKLPRPVGRQRRGSVASMISMVSSATYNSYRGSVASNEGMRRKDSYASSISSGSFEILRQRVRAMGKSRTPRQQAIWRFMEEAESSPGAMAFHWVMNIVVTVNAFFCFIQTTDPPSLTGAFPMALRILFDFFFAVEVVVRFIVCPNRCTFFLLPSSWVDMIAAMPIVVDVVLCATEDCEQDKSLEAIMVILPVARLLKLLRSFEKFHLLLNAFVLAFEALPVLLYTLSVKILFFAAVFYFTEPRSNIANLPQAVWLVIVTMTTVGYGDTLPTTTAGHISACVLILSSVLYMAIPIGIVGGAFSRVWEDRDRLMLIRRTRNRLEQWGYTPRDILELFYLYDRNKSGELDLGEFSEMISEMRLGISTDRVVNLFKTFDTDGSGKVDDQEFVRALYPKGYSSIYRVMTDEIMALAGTVTRIGTSRSLLPGAWAPNRASPPTPTPTVGAIGPDSGLDPEERKPSMSSLPGVPAAGAADAATRTVRRGDAADQAVQSAHAEPPDTAPARAP